jgi:hypothetical protein
MYKICISDNINDLMQEVNSHLERGYKLVGGHSTFLTETRSTNPSKSHDFYTASQYSKSAYVMFTQTMIKVESNEI